MVTVLPPLAATVPLHPVTAPLELELSEHELFDPPELLQLTTNDDPIGADDGPVTEVASEPAAQFCASALTGATNMDSTKIPNTQHRAVLSFLNLILFSNDSKAKNLCPNQSRLSSDH